MLRYLFNFRPRNYVSLLVSLLALTIISPLVDWTWWGDIILSWLMVFMMVSAAMAVSPGRSMTVKLLVFTVLSSGLWACSRALPFSPFDTMQFRLVSQLTIICFLAITGYMMLRHVISSEVSYNTICGALCVYLLIGMCYAIIYSAILTVDAQAISFNASLGQVGKDTGESLSLLMYFSFCTFTTLGYGDITPVHRIARMIAWLEAVTGQLYLTVLVARLVGLHIVGGAQAKSFIADDQPTDQDAGT